MAHAQNRSACRILIVDDEPAVTDLLAYNLRKAHYDVLVAADGRAALRLAKEGKPDLILLDLMIPEVDGLDVCRELRKSSSVPIIMITSRVGDKHRARAIEIGVNDYLGKPYQDSQLLDSIQRLLEERGISLQ